MIKEFTKTVETAAKTVEKGEKAIGKFSKEARQIKHLQKIGAVPVKEFEALKSDVKAQRCGFIAIAAIEGFRMVKDKINSKNTVQVPVVTEKELSKNEVDAIAEALFNKMNIMADEAGYDPENQGEADDQEPEDTEEENG